ncbi:MAG TPA: hypothetical protein VFX97_20580 [Pyrinomonadaceae bacterium]|nr:hypothetical protein [Pyrinomonadaceae bacterium]
MGCCGNRKAATQLEYEVTTAKNGVERVTTMAEVKLKLAAGGGGSYRSVPVKPDADKK